MRLSALVVRYAKLALLALCLVTALAGVGLAAGVMPLVINLDASPGDTLEFQLRLTPGEKPEKVNLSIFKPLQSLEGNLSYEKADPKDFPAADWIRLPAQVPVNPGEDTEVTGTVKVPFSAGGSYIAVVMVEPDFEQKATAITFRMRYAVRLNIRVAKAGLRPTAKVEAFNVVKTKEGSPQFEVFVKNTSALDYLTSAEVTIRNAEKRLVERLELKPEAGWSSNAAEVRIYPFGRLRYFGNPAETLFPGTYDLRLFYRSAGGGPVTVSKVLEVKDGDFTYAAFRLKSLRATPQEVTFEGKPGTTLSKPVRLENRGSKSATVALALADIQSGYEYSILTNAALEMKSSKEVVIGPGRQATVILTAKFPKDAKPRGDYGILKAQVMSEDGKSVIEEVQVQLAAIVAGASVRSAAVGDVIALKEGSGHGFSVVITNTGAIASKPTGSLLLRDAEGKLAGTVKLAPDTDAVASVLPLRRITLTGQFDGLPAGKYTADVKVNEDNLALGTGTTELELE